MASSALRLVNLFAALGLTLGLAQLQKAHLLNTPRHGFLRHARSHVATALSHVIDDQRAHYHQRQTQQNEDVGDLFDSAGFRGSVGVVVCGVMVVAHEGLDGCYLMQKQARIIGLGRFRAQAGKLNTSPRP